MSTLKRLLFADFPAWDDPQACRFQRVRVDEEACDGCKLCVTICPAGVLELYGVKGQRKVRVLDDVRGCISCNNCHAICENRAIAAIEHFAMTGYYRTEGLGAMRPPRTCLPAPE